MLRVSLIGSNGFLGRAITSELGEGQPHSVSSWSQTNDGSFLERGNRLRFLASARPDLVVHLAWLGTGELGYRDDEANWAWAHETESFASEAVDCGARVLLFGSARERWEQDKSHYAESKRWLLSRIREEAFGDFVTWIRPYWIYHLSSMRPSFLTSVLKPGLNGSQRLRFPTQKLDFLSLMDARSAIRHCVEGRVAGGVVDVGSGAPISIEQFVLRVAGSDVSDKASSPVSTIEGPTIQADITRLSASGWRPVFTERELLLDPTRT